MTIRLRRRLIRFCECGCGEQIAYNRRFVFNHHLCKTVFVHKVDCKCISCQSKRGEVSKENHPRYGVCLSESIKEKISNSLIGTKATDEARINMSKAQKISWDKHPERKAQVSKALKISLANPEVKVKMLNAHIGIKYTEDTKKRQSESGKRVWDNMPSEVKSARIKKSLVCNSPNTKEILLGNILNDLYPNEWKFVGNGQLIINGKCPDFVNVNGQKKIIELFGNYWHKDDNPQDRINVFKPFGYSTLIIWEDELNNSNKILRKIKNFSEKYYV